MQQVCLHIAQHEETLMSRWVCTECEYIGALSTFDTVRDPKDENNWWTICPNCRAADQITDVCDEPGCERRATCGWPGKNGGYRRTCFDHSQFKRDEFPRGARA